MKMCYHSIHEIVINMCNADLSIPSSNVVNLTNCSSLIKRVYKLSFNTSHKTNSYKDHINDCVNYFFGES